MCDFVPCAYDKFMSERICMQVVDIGSGRGYLGCHLSLMYHIPVVGIDSSASNTGSAVERTRLLHKHLLGLVSFTCTTHLCVLCSNILSSIQATVISLKVVGNTSVLKVGGQIF